MVVRVPRISDTRVKATAPASPIISKSAPEEAFGGGASSREKSRAAQGLASDVSNVILQEIQKADDASFNELSAQGAQVEIGLGEERSKNLGKNALDYPERENQARDEGQNKILNSAPNRRVKARLQAEFLSFAISGQKATQRHVNSERQKFDAGSLKASVENNRIVALNSGDDQDIQNSILVNEQKIRNYGSSHGLSDDEIQLSTFNATSMTHAQNIERLMAIDTDEAKGYYDVHQKEIDQGTLSKPKLDSKIAAFLKVRFEETVDDLEGQLIDGTLLPEDIGAVSHKRSKGGIGNKEVGRFLSKLNTRQDALITNILRAEKTREGEEAEASLYIELVDNLIKNDVDKFTMRRKLVEMGTRLNPDEIKQLDKMNDLLRDVEKAKKNKIPVSSIFIAALPFQSNLIPRLFRKSKDRIQEEFKNANFSDPEIREALSRSIKFHLNVNVSDPIESEKKSQQATNRIIMDNQIKKNINLQDIPEKGKVFEDALGNRRKIFPDGSYEDVK